MEIPGRDNRKAAEAIICTRLELEALVAHHQDAAKRAIEYSNHDLVKQHLERVEQLRRIMPQSPTF